MSFILDLLQFDWGVNSTIIPSITTIFASGAILSLMTIYIPLVARQFLSESEADAEVRQYGESLFLSKELFATSQRTGLLMLVSFFERKVVVIPDRGLRDKISEQSIQKIIMTMKPFLKKGEFGQAYEAGLKQILNTLGTELKETGKNELSDDIIEEEGV